MKRKSATSLFLSMSLLLGCASLQHASVETVLERRVEYALTLNETIPVVFENGLDGRMDWWTKVLAAISADVTTFAYNRPGYGRSEAVTSPRDGAHVVEELRSLLRSKGLNPPYILVGHSLGGLYMQLFARRYPEDVAALILVDTTHPRQLEGDGALEKQPFFVRPALALLLNDAAEQELALLPQTGEQVLALPTVKDRPVFVLSAAAPLKETSRLANDANEKRRDIARMYPGSKQVWVDCGHGIPLEKPEAVVAAIREALAVQFAGKRVP